MVGWYYLVFHKFFSFYVTTHTHCITLCPRPHCYSGNNESYIITDCATEISRPSRQPQKVSFKLNILNLTFASIKATKQATNLPCPVDDAVAASEKLKASSKFSHGLLRSVDNLTSKQLRQKGLFHIRVNLTHCRSDLIWFDTTSCY